VVELVNREVRHAVKDPAADDPPETGGDLRREVAAGNRRHGGGDGHQQHQAANRINLRRVSPDDALVDDVGHEAGEVQVSHRLRQREDEHDSHRGSKSPNQTEELEHEGSDHKQFQPSLLRRGLQFKTKP
jgi:hypothetical protein